jgi:mannose-1-phosphate guanylyltransferase
MRYKGCNMERHENNLVVVIMAGGVGTRFWPLSTEEKPKQFLSLFDDNRSLLQKSIDRIAGLVARDRVLVLTNKRFVDLAAEQLPEIPNENIIGEPMRRDTAAAVCLSALICRERFGNPVMVILTADHIIEPPERFRETILSAVRSAGKSDVLYTLGIRPAYPSTGYGYLELGRELKDDNGIVHYDLVRFVEKPDSETAKRYVDSGRFLWNSGMFVWSTDSILREIEAHIPAHVEILSGAIDTYRTPQWPRALENAFERIEPVSIDYAVMEKSRKVRCAGCTFSWSDVGGWNAVKDYLPCDEAGNYLRGTVRNMDSSGNLVFCEDQNETLVLIGVKDLVIVRAGGRTLVAHKDRTEEIKKLLAVK